MITPEKKLSRLRGIVVHKQHGHVENSRVDLFTASAILSIYDSLSEINQAKYLAMPVSKMAVVAFKLLGEARS